MNQQRNSNFINGDWCSASGDSFSSINPATTDVIWQGNHSTADDVAAAVASAKTAQSQWRKQTQQTRQQLILDFAELLTANKDKLALAIHQETGKPLWETKTETAAMIGKAQLSLNSAATRCQDSAADLTGFSTQLVHRPIGVFVVLGPYNFPGHLPNGQIIPALLAGNAVVFKPSEQTPYVAQLMLQLWQKVGLPKGLINLVQGGANTGQALIENPDINGVLFTGSHHVGALIHKQFAGKPEIMLALEMGGNNPLVVDGTGDIDAAVYNIVQSAFLSSGQRCTCARRLLLLDNPNNRVLVESLIDYLPKIIVGEQGDAFMGSLISQKIATQLMTAQSALIASGAEPLLPMQWAVSSERPFLTPGLLDVTKLPNKLDQELFGPLLQLQWMPDLTTAIGEANNTQFGLSAGLLSDSEQAWQQFSQEIRAGIVNWNRPLTGASGSAPFGGPGASGNYRPGAFYSADFCAYPMASMLEKKLRKPEAMPPGIPA